MALENNQELVVQKLQPQIVKTAVDEARAIFDPILFGSVGREREQGELVRGLDTQNSFITDTWVEEVGVQKFFPTGTTIGFGATTEMADKARQRQLVQSRLGLTVTQALLRGFGPEVNLAAVRQAKLDTISSEYELRGFALMLVADVEATYWDYVLYTHEIEVLEQSVRMAEEQLKNIQERVKAGTAPQMELSAAEAEIALRRQDVVEAQSSQGKALVHLRRLLNLPGGDPWTRELRLLDRLSAPAAPVDDVELHAQLAMRMRPEINAAKLGIERGDLQIVRTKNGLLPKLDLFLTVGKSGYAQSFGNAWKNIGGDEHDLLVGVSAKYPAGNHEARGRYQRAVLTRRAADESVKNLEQIVQEEVRTAYLEARRAKEQIAASADTRKLDEEKLRVEAERFMLGRATSFQVARAQRDLAKSRVAEVRAAAEYQKALAELYRADGSLLERRGVSAPGRDPPKGATASR
jgi:outer membrane protein TolC